MEGNIKRFASYTHDQAMIYLRISALINAAFVQARQEGLVPQQSDRDTIIDMDPSSLDEVDHVA